MIASCDAVDIGPANVLRRFDVLGTYHNS